MNMKKLWQQKLIVWLMVFTLLGGMTLHAEPVKRSDVAFQDMQYEKVASTDIENLIKIGKELIDKNDKDKFLKWEKDYLTLYYKLMGNTQLAHLYYELDYTDSYFYNEYLEGLNLIGKMKSEYLALIDADDQSVSENMKQYYQLSANRQELVDKYNNYYYSTVIEYDGKKMGLVDIIRSKDLTKEEKDNLVYGKWYDTYNKQCGQIFLKIVALDKEMAKLSGYDSVAESMYDSYGRGYSPSKMETFSKYVKAYVPEVYKKLDALEQKTVKDLVKYTYGTDQDLISSIDDSFITYYPELKEAYNYLKKYNLYDITPNSNKSLGGFTSYLSLYEEPFISLNYNMDYQTLTALIHEFGHFNFEYITGNADVSLDLGETYSQGLEFLAFPHYEKILGSKELSDAIKVVVATDSVKAILDGCIYNEFLNEVYKNSNMTVEEMNKLYGRICKEYGLSVDERDWVEVEHNFEMPYYYSSYTMSAIASLEIWEKAITDQKQGMDTYLKLIETGTQYDLENALDKAGLSNPFAEGTVKKVMTTMDQYFEQDTEKWSNAA